MTTLRPGDTPIQRLRDKITREKGLKKLKQNTDADALAGDIRAVIQWMSTLARDGSTRKKLSSIAAQAMLAWPNPD